MIRRRYARYVVLVPLIVGAAAVHIAAQRSAKNKGNTTLFIDPARRFALEIPKDWTQMMVAASGEPLAVFIHPRREASVVVEHFTLPNSLANDAVQDIEAMVEMEQLSERQPQATIITGKIESEGGRNRVVIDYNRSVIDPERVRQISYPDGKHKYRITCMTLADRFLKYEPVCSTAASSLKFASELGKAPTK